MSCVCILTRVVIAAWPAFSAAVVSAAASLGYEVVASRKEREAEAAEASNQVTLELAQSELVTGTLGRDQRLSVSRDGVTITFERDERGRASICVTGSGHDESTLRQLGEELGGRVVQKYVYQKLMVEMKARQFNVIEEEVDETNTIRLKVRHWN